MRIALIVAFFVGLAASGTARAGDLCPAWSPPAQIGAIDSAVLKEASGIAVSRRYPGRLYHNQDSGDGPNFYLTDLTGAHTQTVAVKGFTPLDVEDIALGACGPRRTCLFLGDVGDNRETRDAVQIVLVPEKAKYRSVEKPLRIVVAKYPDRAHNVEALAIHPNGDLFVITKSFSEIDRRALTAQVFKLTAAQIAKPGKTETFTEVGQIELPYLLYDYGLPGQIATGMDISDDGQKLLLVTYANAIEIALDLSKPIPPTRTWKPGRDYRVIAIAKLPQTEAIAYTADQRGFIYDSETVRDGAPSPLYGSKCVGAAAATAK